MAVVDNHGTLSKGYDKLNYYTISGWANDPDGDSSASVASHFHA